MADANEIRDLKKQIEDLYNQLKAAGSVVRLDLQQAFRDSNDEVSKLKELLTKLDKEYDNIVDNADYVYKTFKDISAELRSQNLLLTTGKSIFKQLTDVAQDLSYFQKGNTDLTSKQFKNIQQNIKAQKDELEFVVKKLEASQRQRDLDIAIINDIADREGKLTAEQKKRLDILQKENALLVNAKETLNSGLPILQKEYDLSKQISKTREDLGGVAQATGKILSNYVGNFLNLNDALEAVEEHNKNIVKEALKDEKVREKLLQNEAERLRLQKELEIASNPAEREEIQKRIVKKEEEAYNIRQAAIASTNTLVNKTKALGVLLGEASKSLVKGLTDPVTIFKFFITAAINADKQVTQIAKSLVLTKSQANQVREQFVSYSRNLNDAFITTNKLLEANAKLNETLGLATTFTFGLNKEFVNLTQKVGLSEEAAAGLAKVIIASGKPAREITSSTVAAIEQVKQETKLRLNNKQILEATSKVSGQLLANFKGNPAAIAEAIAKMQALGTTLEQTKSQAESLLNFESSIESELKAELITGKQINLERARMAALMGDQKTVAEELSRQAVDYNKFSNMNVIAQRSLAEALGLSADQLSDQLFKQQYLNKSKEEVLALGGEEALQRMEALSAQDKFNSAVEKLQDILGNLVAGPLGRLIDGFANLASNAYVLYGLLGAMAGISFVKLIAGLAASAVQAGILAAGAISASSALTFGVAAIAIAAGIGLAMAALSDATDEAKANIPKAADGGVVPATPGGRLVRVAEGGKDEAIIPLNSPKAANALGVNNTSIDLTPMINAINEVRNAVDRLSSRPSYAVVDEASFSKGVGRSNTGAEMVKNSYQLT